MMSVYLFYTGKIAILLKLSKKKPILKCLENQK